MWKQFKKEILVGGLMVAVLSFSLGCLFNSSTDQSFARAGIEQRVDKGQNDPGQNDQKDFGQKGQYPGPRDGQPGKEPGNGPRGGCPGRPGGQGPQDKGSDDSNGQNQTQDQQQDKSQNQTQDQQQDKSQNQTQDQKQDQNQQQDTSQKNTTGDKNSTTK